MEMGNVKKGSLKEQLNRIEEKLELGEKREITKKKKKSFQWPSKFKRTMNKSLKQPQNILVFFLSRTGVFEPPRLLPILDGDMVIVKGRPYEVNPKAFWRFGKYNLLIIREIDRRPVSNLDYNKIKARGDATDSDAFLIKMAMRAVQLAKKPIPSKMIMIVIGIIIVGIIIFMFAK